MRPTEHPGVPATRGVRGGVDELVERCRQGDETAFRELVDQYKGLVFGLIARSIANRARAEELAQDVFLKVHKGLPYFRGEAKLSTWMYRIVINVLSQERPELATASLDDRDEDDRPRLQPAADDRAFGDLVMARVVQDRWRAERAIDLGFNLAIAAGVLVIVAAGAGLAWSLGLLSITIDLDAIVRSLDAGATGRLLSQVQTVAMSAVLLTMALVLWWWAEAASE